MSLPRIAKLAIDEDAVPQLEAIGVGPSDIIVLRNMEHGQVRDFCDSAQRGGWPHKNPLLMLHSDQGIETVSEERMRALGYERIKE